VTYRPHRCAPLVSGSEAACGRRRELALFVIFGTLVALLAAVPAFASPPTISGKQAEARQVLQEVNGLNGSLDRADERLNLANLRLSQVGHDIQTNRRELRVAKANLKRSQQQIAERLVNLYVNGQTSTLEVILGAKNLEDVLSRADDEHRVSSLDNQIADQVQIFKAAVKRHALELKVEQGQVKSLVAERQEQEHAISVRLGEKRSLLSSLNGEIERLIAAQQAAEERLAQQARERAAAAQAEQNNLVNDTVIGATADSAEGETILPPADHSGVVGIAEQYLGVPYVWGGATPSGFDCSGLVMYAYAQMGVSLPHSSYAMWNYGVAVPEDQLQPGDLVFFNGLGHVGIYVGDGDYIEAPHTGAFVQISSLTSGWAASSYVGARRIL
jgi:cell wall-associated NlpC family hydrolase